MDGYSSLFMSGLKAQAIPRTPPRVRVGERKFASNGRLQPPQIIRSGTSPSRTRVFRKRKSSISQEINPIAGIKSPTRNARSSLLSPVTEKRFFDFAPTSLGSAINFLRRPRVRPPQKPMPTVPLPAIPMDASSPPSTPKKAHSILPPSSPIMPEAVFNPSKNCQGLRKQSKDRLPKLRLKTSGIFNSRSGPLSASFNMNVRNPSRAPSPGLLSPDFAYSMNTASSGNVSTALQTPLTGPFNIMDWGVKEVHEEEEEFDVDMN